MITWCGDPGWAAWMTGAAAQPPVGAQSALRG